VGRKPPQVSMGPWVSVLEAPLVSVVQDGLRDEVPGRPLWPLGSPTDGRVAVNRLINGNSGLTPSVAGVTCERTVDGVVWRWRG